MFALSRFGCAEMDEGHNGVEIVRHGGADDHLVLSAAGYHLKDIRQGGQRLLVRLSLICQLKAQPGCAVDKAADVFLAAHEPDDVFCFFLVLHSRSSCIEILPKK